jgi:galactokinase
VRFAKEQGAVAASAFGAGFGGSVWAMVRSERADEFTAEWRERYAAAHKAPGRRSQFFATEPSAPAFELRGDAE